MVPQELGSLSTGQMGGCHTLLPPGHSNNVFLSESFVTQKNCKVKLKFILLYTRHQQTKHIYSAHMPLCLCMCVAYVLYRQICACVYVPYIQMCAYVCVCLCIACMYMHLYMCMDQVLTHIYGCQRKTLGILSLSALFSCDNVTH